MLLVSMSPLLLTLPGCDTIPHATTSAGSRTPIATLPLRTAWFDNLPVHYVTTDVSDADVARAQGANFVPRLRDLLPAAGATAGARPALLERVYAVIDSTQPTVFASAPGPAGPDNRGTVYTPLWRMVTVAWQPGRTPVELRSEEAVLQAEERRDVALHVTDVVLNCPVFEVVGRGALPGSSTR